MQDQFPLQSCFFSGADGADLGLGVAATKSGQGAVMSVYRTMIAGRCRLITVTWCRNLLANGLSVSVEGSDDASERSGGGGKDGSSCKVELRPWYFWRRQGSKRFYVEARPVDVFWDLKGAKFSGDPEPHSDYYVAVVSDDEVVLLVGDLQKALRRTGSRLSAIEATLVSRKEHVFGKKKFVTRAKFHEKDKFHEISIECNNGDGGGGSGSILSYNVDPDMVMRIDGRVLINVKHLQWKFRGNHTILVDGVKVEVYWDVHDWLFEPGMRHALFIIKPAVAAPSPAPAAESLFSIDGSGGVGGNGGGGGGASTPGFCLFLYHWKVE